MKFETMNQNDVTFVSRAARKSKYDDLFLSLRALETGKCVVIKADGKSVEKLRANLYQLLRNHKLDNFSLNILNDETGVVINKKEIKSE